MLQPCFTLENLKGYLYSYEKHEKIKHGHFEIQKHILLLPAQTYIEVYSEETNQVKIIEQEKKQFDKFLAEMGGTSIREVFRTNNEKLLFTEQDLKHLIEYVKGRMYLCFQNRIKIKKNQ